MKLIHRFIIIDINLYCLFRHNMSSRIVIVQMNNHNNIKLSAIAKSLYPFYTMDSNGSS